MKNQKSTNMFGFLSRNKPDASQSFSIDLTTPSNPYTPPAPPPVKSGLRLKVESLFSRSIGLNANADIQQVAVNRISGYGTQTTLSYSKSNLTRTRSAARHLARTDSLIASYVSIVNSNVIGPKGISFSSNVRDANGNAVDAVNNSVETLWGVFTKAVSVCGELNLTDFLNLIQTCESVDGEYLIRIHTATDPKNVPNDLGFAVEVIPVEYLDETLNVNMTNGDRIVMGVRLNKYNKPIAYYLKPPLITENPLADLSALKREGQHYVLPADQAIHGFVKAEPAQVRGVTPLVSVIGQVAQLADYTKAVVASEQIAASKMAFLTRTVDGADLEDEHPVIDATPGSFLTLPDNYSVSNWTPAGSGAIYEQVTKRSIRNIASGLKMSYNALANDLESTSYSSIRSGMLQERITFKTMQSRRISDLTYILQTLLQHAAKTGKLKTTVSIAEILDNVNFVAKGFPWIDPQKDADASITSVNAGLSSKTKVLEEQGESYEDVLAQLAREKRLEAKYGFQMVVKDKSAAPNPADANNPSLIPE